MDRAEQAPAGRWSQDLRVRFVGIAMIAVAAPCVLFAAARAYVQWSSGRATPWWANAAGFVAILALYAWYRHAPRRRGAAAVHATAAVATVALLVPAVAYGMPSSLWWLSLVGFATALMSERREALIWAAVTILLVVAVPSVEEKLRIANAAGEAPIEAYLSRAAFVVALLGTAYAFRREIQRTTAGVVALAKIVDAREREIARQAEQLRAALTDAEDAVAARNRLLANTSHELRTPLQGIVGGAELLLRDEDDAGRRQLLLTVLRCGEGMLELVNDLLDLSRLRSGTLLLKSEWFEVGVQVATVIESLVTLAQQRGLALESEIAPGTHPTWIGDPQRLRQILFNLISNAIKFTDSGSVCVKVWQPAGQTLRFEVRDTGVGILQSNQEKIFEPFMQLDAHPDRWVQGAGLGLTISRQLVHLMGGWLEVESNFGAGSLFHFEVTLEPAPAGVETSQRVTPLATANAAVLLVDDNEVNRELIAAQMKSLGIECATANDGFAALAHLMSNPCDLVLMDCQMPGMDGYEVTRRIRERWPQRPIRIIAITAHASPGESDRCRAAGMDDYLSKPVRLADLRVAVGRHLGAE